MEIILTVVLGVLGFPVVVHYFVDALSKRNQRINRHQKGLDKKPLA